MGPRSIGILLNQSRCAYSYALGAELDAAAAAYHIKLSYLPVDWAQSHGEVDPDELQAFLERAQSEQGLVMISSVFSHGLKSLAKFAQSWWPRPASSIGYRLPLVPSVLVDNREAMRTATNHLIQKHGRRSILFLRGRADSQEANDRYFGFRQALSENHIINDSARVLQGDFTGASAVSALSALPAQLSFDGLIAANDEMALAAVVELEQRGIHVPQDVSVIGFDDIPQASRGNKPLTTMAQPFEALARTALELVIAQCDGRTVQALEGVPVGLVPRSSCGCAAQRSAPRARPSPH